MIFLLDLDLTGLRVRLIHCGLCLHMDQRTSACV